MFKVDDLSHLKLTPNHYLGVQYTRALQFATATTTNMVMCQPTKGNKASTVGVTSDVTTGQFADATTPAAPTTHPLEGMPVLEDSEPLIGAVVPDTATYESTGNKFTRSHSPGTEDNESDDPPTSSQGTTAGSLPNNLEQDDGDHLPALDVCSGTPDLIVDQLIQEQHEPVETPTQQDATLPTSPASIQSANVMIDPLQVLLASAPPVMGSPTITKEEDQLLGTEEVTTEEVAARPPPQPIQDPLEDATPDDKDDFKLTTTDVGDNMENI